MVDGHRVQRQSALTPNQPSSPGEIDSSWPLFSMYSNVAEEEDNKKIERYQKEAEAFLIFVSHLRSFQIAAHVD